MCRDIHGNYSNGQLGSRLGSFIHRSIPTEGTQYNTFIGRSGDGKRGATRESGTHYLGVSVTARETPGETDDRTDLRPTVGNMRSLATQARSGWNDHS